jgi:peroxiredoxin (alkyl hydroperoxide reductase subunit C)
MTIKVGDPLPAGKFKTMTAGGPQELTTDQIFAGKRVLLVSVPGAFTPTCHTKHLPGYVARYDELKRQGIDAIACMAVNDVHVMDAWGKASGVGDKVLMLADGSADYTRALGLELDLSSAGLGLRGKRFALVAKDGVVEQLNLEAAGEFKVSSAEQMLCRL